MLVTMSDFLTHYFPRQEILFALILLSIGCTTQLYWAKSDAQPGEFEEDVRQCRQSLISNPDEKGISETLSRVFKLSEDVVAQCLMAKGWFLAEKP